MVENLIFHIIKLILSFFLFFKPYELNAAIVWQITANLNVYHKLTFSELKNDCWNMILLINFLRLGTWQIRYELYETMEWLFIRKFIGRILEKLLCGSEDEKLLLIIVGFDYFLFEFFSFLFLLSILFFLKKSFCLLKSL